jgi:hypothetical protein
MIRALAAVPLLAALACSGGGSALTGDGAVPAEGGAEAGAVPTNCELATQAGCAANQQCSAFCQSQQLVIACRTEPASPPAIGAPCMNVPCVRGSLCMATTGKEATCAKTCTTTPDCAQGQACRDVTVTYGCATTGPTIVHIKACI